MHVGLIGLGDIAQKAYLPVIGVREDVTIHLCTRNRDRLHQLSSAYRISPEYCSTDVEDLIKANLDAVFIHAATDAHYHLVKRCLQAGLHVFVDKPVSYSLSLTEELMALARQNQRILMVGFNRRFAPMYRELYDEGTPDIVVMQKNRVALPGDVRTFVLDDFIHVIDTIRFVQRSSLSDMQVQWKRTVDGQLANIVVSLVGAKSTAIGIMNRDSGATEETLEWMGNGKKYKVTNLRQMVTYASNHERHTHAGDWTSIGKVRGFEAMINTFLHGVVSLQQDMNATWSEFSGIMDEDLMTHRICEEIVRRIEA